MLNLYNTLTKKIEEIKPASKDHLNMYSCGPTVYNFAHIGNLRSFILADLLYRTLKMDNYNPRWVMNITDIDDKTIKGTIEKYGKSAGLKELYDFTEFYYQAFLNDLREVNVSVDAIQFIRVTDKMAEIQAFILELINKGYAYKAEDGSTYFSIEKYQKDFGDYGELVGNKFLQGKKIGARVKVDEYEKDNLSDFALWKAHSETDGNIFWDHPILGKGRPGWHVECSVINHLAFKGELTDIHTGGVDLIFPHHTNEIAQSQALLGKGNFVKHWFHSEHLLVDGKKMSKSANNFYTLKDLENQSIALRLLYLQSHYQTQQNFTKESFDAAKNGLESLINKFKENKDNENFKAGSLFENLNSPKAISENSSGAILKNLLGEDLVTLFMNDINISDNSDLSELISMREEARKQKDFKKSDELRKQIEDLGYEVLDTSKGYKIKKK